MHINTCPAIRQLRDSKRKILPCFCQYCYYLNQARAEAAGPSMKVEGMMDYWGHTLGEEAPDFAPFARFLSVSGILNA